MTLRTGSPQQLLMPANPVFIWSTLLIALVLNMLPLGRTAWTPDMLMLLLVFWSVHQPLRIGMGTAFVLGLFMDVHQAALLGQHALAYTAVSFFAMVIHRRLLWFSVPKQAIQVLPLFLVAHTVEVLIRLATGGVLPGWQVLLPPLIETVLWPVACVVLLAPQRRPPDRDENRPL